MATASVLGMAEDPEQAAHRARATASCADDLDAASDRPYGRFQYDAATDDATYRAQFLAMAADKQARLDALARFSAAPATTASPTNAAGHAADFFEFCVDTHGDRPAVESVVDQRPAWSFRAFDAYTNAVAAWALRTGLRRAESAARPGRGHAVALMAENAPAFLALTLGFAKIGCAVALINTNLAGAALLHALQTADPHAVLVTATLSERLRDAVAASATGAAWAPSGGVHVMTFPSAAPEPAPAPALPAAWTAHPWSVFETAVADVKQPPQRPDPALRADVQPRDPLYYIFTSGTTGASKAAKFSHRRFVGCAVTWAGPSLLRAGDGYYIALPLYHGNGGCVAVAPCLLLGCRMAIRPKFSVTHFWRDVRRFHLRGAVYVGELWRYLLTRAPETDAPDAANVVDANTTPLRVIIGNGLAADCWEAVKQRWGIQHVVEHFGATEMPGDSIINYFNVPGKCGFLPPDLAARQSLRGASGRLFAYDADAGGLQRDAATGLCIPVTAPDTPGEMLMFLPDGQYDGYVGAPELTQRKLVIDVMEPGDQWWTSGDLLACDARGFYTFVDRLGDTFRWKGENVATCEVQAACMAAAPAHVAEVNVYGVAVPHASGKAGMAAVLLRPAAPVDAALAALAAGVQTQLPAYARPLFLRLRNEPNATTATLKFQKQPCVRAGFDPAAVGDDHVYYWSRDASAYVALTPAVYTAIQAGTLRF